MKPMKPLGWLFDKPCRFAICYGALLICAITFTLLDTFLIPRALSQVEPSKASQTPQPTIVTDTTYQDANITINLSTHRQDGTTYYVADIQLTDAALLKAAFAQGVYGRNIKENTSQIAQEVGAILAINGDYYGYRDDGWVIRNGQTYRTVSRREDALGIDVDGDFYILSQADLAGASTDTWWQVFSFGPALVTEGEVAVTASDEVAQSMTSNPRTAIGQIGPLHYVFIVSDGRTSQSTGFSLVELAQLMADLGCQTAYNLDGGGSSTLVFMGSVINQPTSNGKRIAERSVSDIVYIGY